jgi:hypothetical protein
MTHVADHSIPGPLRPQTPVRPRRSRRADHHLRSSDTRWPAVAAALAKLRAAKRCSVRIVDADCGTGALLLWVARYARSLGFTAIEARGIDGEPLLIDRARVSACDVPDLAIDLRFEANDLLRALGEEAEFPADIILWHGRGCCSEAEATAVACAGRTLIAEPGEVA